MEHTYAMYVELWIGLDSVYSVIYAKRINVHLTFLLIKSFSSTSDQELHNPVTLPRLTETATTEAACPSIVTEFKSRQRSPELTTEHRGVRAVDGAPPCHGSRLIRPDRKSG